MFMPALHASLKFKARTATLTSALLAMCFAFAGAGCGKLMAQTDSPDQVALRRLAERFYRAYEPDDRTEFLSLWSSRSIDPESKPHPSPPGYEQRRLVSLQIQAVQITGDTAKVRVRVRLSGVLKPGLKASPGIFNNESLMTLRCVKEDGTWKVMAHALTEHDLADEFADELINAGNNDDRRALWLARPERHKREQIYALLQRNDETIAAYDFEKWVDVSNLAMKLATQLGDERTVAMILNQLAVAYHGQGNQTLALEYYLRSLDVSDHSPDPNVRAANNYVRANIGVIYADQGNYEQALAWYQRGLNPEKPQTSALSNIANAYKNLGDYPRALEYYNRVMQVGELLPPARGRDRVVINALAGIGSVYFAQNNYAQAQQHYEKALAIAEAAPEATRPLTIIGAARELIPGLLHSLAEIELARGNARRAVELGERALGLRKRQANGPGADPGMQSYLARAYLALGEKERAREVLEKAIAASEYRRQRAAGGEQGRQRYFEQLIAPYHDMIKLLASDQKPADAFVYAERSKSRALLDILAGGRAEARKFLTTEEKKRDLALRKSIALLNRDLAAARGSTNQNHVAALEAMVEKARLEYESFQTNIDAVHPELRLSRGEMTPISLAEAGQLLPDQKTALIEFVVTGNTTYLFVITKSDSGSQPQLKFYPIEINQKSLEKQVRSYREQIARRDPGFHENATKLFTLLLGPALTQVSGKSSLVIVPDGVLWDLPFQALRGESRRYLIEDFTISYAPSLTALREIVKSTRRRKVNDKVPLDLLAMGNPTNGAVVQNRIRTGLMDYASEPLPEAEKQVLALGQLYGVKRSKVYTGAAATEHQAKTDAPDSRIIQFATHGILDSRSPMYSQLVLSQGGENEDGLLEAWEIMNLNLRADLVVLAACETARGRVAAGEGMIGMAWAFFVAGSSTTVASQWKVDSASTTELMLEFHRHLKKPPRATRIAKAKALQLAALKLLQSKQYQHPFNWAGFVLLGDGF